MKNILITGGAGFIGSNLIRTLKQKYKDINIISLDNYSSGNDKNHVKEEGIKYIKGDTWNICEIEEIQNFQPEYVFHFGEFSRIVLSFEKPRETFFSNTIGTQQVLQYCVEKKAKLIYSGSSAIFGNDMKDQHLNPYSFTKAKNIELIKNYKNWFNLDYVICYFYNVFGPGQINEGAYATVIGIFEKQYKNNLPLTVVKPGTQKRCFTHINDIIDGIILVANDGDGDGYFLGSKENISIIDIAKMFKTKYEMIDERKGERKISTIIDNEKMDNLGWKVTVNIKDYINSKVIQV
jgi:UDP-glucose 4-epimerase